MGIWAQLELGALCEFQAGSAFPRSEQGEGEGELPFVKVSDMNLAENSQRIINANNWISRDVAKRIKARAVPKDATVFAKIGEALKAERLRLVVRDTVIDNNMMAAIPNSQTDARFLRYLLEFIHLAKWAEGSALPYLRSNDLKKISVKVPSITEQRAIAGTLGALDDKLESNYRLQRILDELFQAKWYSLYQSDLCRNRSTLASHVTTQYGLTASAIGTSDGPKFLRVTDINKRNWLNWSEIPHVSVSPTDMAKYALERGDLLVARMADPGKSAIYEDSSTPAVFASYLVRLKPKTFEDALFIFGFLKSPFYVDYAQSVTTGSVQKNMNARLMTEVELFWPVQDALKKFAHEVTPIRARLLAAVKESAQLRELRDTILPLLLSGTLSVSEVFQ